MSVIQYNFVNKNTINIYEIKLEKETSLKSLAAFEVRDEKLSN